jgi:hypothetical protein
MGSLTPDRARVKVMDRDPSRRVARDDEAMQGPEMPANELTAEDTAPPARREGPLVLSDVYLLTAESQGKTAVPGLTVQLDGSGLTVRKPDGTTGAFVAWSDVSGLVADRRMRTPDAPVRGPQRQSRRAPIRNSPPGGHDGGGEHGVAPGGQAEIRGARRGTCSRHRCRHRARCPGRDRYREILSRSRPSDEAWRASHQFLIVTQSQYR